MLFMIVMIIYCYAAKWWHVIDLFRFDCISFQTAL